LLVLDEPTNDLDVETLELLEEVLLGFQGTVLMVSHDRAFLDNVVTSTLVFQGGGEVREYVGGYQDWLRQGGSPRLLGVAESGGETKDAKKAQQAPVAPVAAEVAPAKKKLSYKLQRELEALPGKIDEAEQAIEALQTQISDPAFYQQPADVTAAVLSRLEALQLELDGLLERWAELEE
ncbi:MAG TPA: ABC transporter ATP-binding protein, partial [Pseudomonas sp.]|nr:ABC transporter ATP-binding protein [Pseudomonas sp.]